MMSIDGFGAGLHQRLEPFGDHTAKGAEAMPGTQGDDEDRRTMTDTPPRCSAQRARTVRQQ
jgi:hypothetical protein